MPLPTPSKRKRNDAVLHIVARDFLAATGRTIRVQNDVVTYVKFRNGDGHLVEIYWNDDESLSALWVKSQHIPLPDASPEAIDALTIAIYTFLSESFPKL